MDHASLAGGAKRMYGVMIGIVTDNKHPDGEYRVKVKLPWIRSTDAGDDEDFISTWARISTPMAGPKRGLWLLPEVDDEVLVMFEHGDARSPIIVGSLWNGQDLPPVSGESPDDSSYGTADLGSVELKIKDVCVDTNEGAGKNNARFFYSRSGHLLLFDDDAESNEDKIVLKTAHGHTIVLNDAGGKESIAIYDSTGEEYIVLDEANKKIVMETKNGDIDVFCKNGTFTLEAKDIKTHASASIENKSDSTTKHESGSAFDIKAGATCTIKGGPKIDLNP